MKNLKIVVINGHPQSGKDSFVFFTSRNTKNITIQLVSSVDNVKQAAKLLGWDGIKTLKGRKFLSDLKDISTREYDGPLKYMSDIIYKHTGLEKKIIFFMIREPEEIQGFIKEHPSAISLLIERKEIETNEYSNHADQNIKKFNYDYIIDNNSTLEDLENKAISFINII